MKTKTMAFTLLLGFLLEGWNQGLHLQVEKNRFSSGLLGSEEHRDG